MQYVLLVILFSIYLFCCWITCPSEQEQISQTISAGWGLTLVQQKQTSVLQCGFIHSIGEAATASKESTVFERWIADSWSHVGFCICGLPAG